MLSMKAIIGCPLAMRAEIVAQSASLLPMPVMLGRNRYHLPTLQMQNFREYMEKMHHLSTDSLRF
jgi:hypothetical protein